MGQKVSVYIPCYNVEEYLARSIEGVLRQTHGADEILIVDDGSRDGTAEVAARYAVRILRHERNRGLAAARNTALRSARNDLVAALDADCVPEPDWLEKLVVHLGDATVAAAGGRLLETVQSSAADRWRKAHMPQEWGEAPARNPRFMFGSNVVLRKSVVEEVGWYDENLRTNGEDVDLSARLRARGYSFVYDPQAGVKHLRHDTVRSVLDAYWRWWRYGVRAYSNGIRLRSVLGHLYSVHFRTNFFGLVRQDLRSRNYGLLWLDVLALLYMPYRDLGLLVEASTRPRPSTISREA